MLLSMLFGIIISLVTAYIVLKIHDTGSASWRDMVNIKSFFVTGIITTLLAMLGTLGGMILFIIPGLYFATHWMLSVWAVVDGKGSATECLKYSYAIVKGNALCLVGLILAMAFIGFPVGMLAKLHQPGTPITLVTVVMVVISIVGQLILSGVSAFAFAYVYRKLSNAYEQKRVSSSAVQMPNVESNQ